VSTVLKEHFTPGKGKTTFVDPTGHTTSGGYVSEKTCRISVVKEERHRTGKGKSERTRLEKWIVVMSVCFGKDRWTIVALEDGRLVALASGEDERGAWGRMIAQVKAQGYELRGEPKLVTVNTGRAIHEMHPTKDMTRCGYGTGYKLWPSDAAQPNCAACKAHGGA